jgi:enoyl reductase
VPVQGWTPPSCWYEPRTASEIRDYVEGKLQDWQSLPDEDIDRTRTRLTDHYRDGQPYRNYNLAVADDGVFWVGVVNPERRDDPGALTCSGYGVWAEHDEPVPVGELAVTAQMLAEAAYEWLPLPEVDLALSPDVELPQVVNLATWIWQESGVEEVSATASLDRLGLAVTTTATPVSLALDPGAADATVHAEDGRCSVNADGSIGQAWESGRESEIPPCGVTYHRAGEGFELTATVTWSVSWTGTGQATPERLPDALMETSHTLTVREVQTIVR